MIQLTNQKILNELIRFNSWFKWPFNKLIRFNSCIKQKLFDSDSIHDSYDSYNSLLVWIYLYTYIQSGFGLMAVYTRATRHNILVWSIDLTQHLFGIDSIQLMIQLGFSKKWIESSSDSSGYEKCDSILFMIQLKSFDSDSIHDSNQNRLQVWQSQNRTDMERAVYLGSHWWRWAQSNIINFSCIYRRWVVDLWGCDIKTSRISPRVEGTGPRNILRGPLFTVAESVTHTYILVHDIHQFGLF